MGRLVLQEDFTPGTSGAVFSRALSYDAAGRLTIDDATTRRYVQSGTVTTSSLHRSRTTNSYLAGTSLVGTATTQAWKNGVDADAPDTATTNTYEWREAALLKTVSFDENTGSSSNTVWVTTNSYNAFAQLTGVGIQDGRPRTVTLKNSADGQAIRRDEADGNASTGDPHEVYYRMGGKHLGTVGNNGTGNVAYVESTGQRTRALDPWSSTSGPFRGGATAGAAYADFGLGYEALNSFAQGGGGGSYLVQAGDTLQGIAQALWGDAALWYKLAEANGLSAASALSAGRSLTIPAGVTRTHHNAGTFKPYDPAEIVGDTSPTTPKPAKGNKCGAFGQIMLAVVAIAVTALTRVPLTNLFGSAFLGGAAAGAAGSVVSQAVGVGTGIQSKFSFKGAAMSALSAGLAPGSTGNFMADAINGAVTSATVQGIGVATGLQDKFSWAGVAAAGIAAGVGARLGRNLAPLSGSGLSAGNIASHVAVGGARLLASAATRSAIEGTSFGDNIRAGLSDVIGQIVVQAMGGAIGNARARAAAEAGAATGVATPQPGAMLAANPVANNGGVDTQGEAIAAAAEENVILVTAPRLGTRSAAGSTAPSYGEHLGFSYEGSPLVGLPDEASVRSTLNASLPGLRIDPKSVARFAGRTAVRRAAIVDALWPTTAGELIEVPVYGMEGVSLTRWGDIPDWNLESNGERIGYIGDDDLENVLFIDTLEGTPGQFAGTSINAIVIRAFDGVDVGFGVSIQTRREAEIYNDGLANKWDSNAINAAIAEERAITGNVAGKYSPGEIRYAPGTAFVSEMLPYIDGQWLRGTDRNAGVIPAQVAGQLAGQRFESFDRFREAFWTTVGNTPELANQFSRQNQARMMDGYAPIAPESQHVGDIGTYMLHHRNPIQRGGPVYDMSNLMVVTPRYHQEVLDPSYHYGQRR